MEVYKEFILDAAHFLPHVPEGHKCARIHGHTFNISIYVKGKVDPKLGWVIDFGDIKSVFKPYYDMLDHHFLNEIAGLENPTSENLAIWIWDRIHSGIPGLYKVVVQETPTCAAIYYGDAD